LNGSSIGCSHSSAYPLSGFKSFVNLPSRQEDDVLRSSVFPPGCTIWIGNTAVISFSPFGRHTCIYIDIVECFGPNSAIEASAFVIHLFLSSSSSLDQHFADESRIIDSFVVNYSVFRLYPVRLQAQLTCSSSE